MGGRQLLEMVIGNVIFTRIRVGRSFSKHCLDDVGSNGGYVVVIKVITVGNMTDLWHPLQKTGVAPFILSTPSKMFVP